MRRHFQRPDLRAALLTLAAASAVGTAIVVARIFVAGQFRQLYLVWNLFLAWLPLYFALRVEELDQSGSRRGVRFWLTAAAWLLFFPNAPYIFTDLIHITRSGQTRIWTDLLIVLVFAVTGLVLGFLSLQRMQMLVARRRGRVAGWVFVFAVALLSGFGVYLGRFERWNSWDAVMNPFGLLGDAANWLHIRSAIFTVLFGVFVFTAYAMLYSLTLIGPAIHFTARGPHSTESADK